MIDTVNPQARLTNLQAEFLKLFALRISDEDLIQIKNMVWKYLALKASDIVDSECDKRNYTEEEINSWIYEKS